MFTKLHIRNYAIIEQLDISFDARLNIITGETGAGKSILMGALSLILGDRADTTVLMDREQKSVVEGLFSIEGNTAVAALLRSYELDEQDALIIRREIAPNGKSRAFVNDTPVNLEQLRAISECMVDLHRQFDTLSIGVSDFQRSVVDALADQIELVQTYQQHYQQWQSALKAEQQLLKEKEQFLKEYDYNRFLFEELEQAAFKPNEIEDAEQALKRMSGAEGIRAALEHVSEGLNGGDQPLSQQLRSMVQALQAWTALHPELPALAERLQSAYIELKDIGEEASQLSDKITYDPQEMATLQERIALGYTLQKKHGVQSTEALLQLQDTLSEKLQNMMHLDDAITAKSAEVTQWHGVIQKEAVQIHQGRASVIPSFEKSVHRLLAEVGMPNARLKVTLEAVALNAFGSDQLEFLFDANNSGRMEPVRKVASGGELSRLMLCIKSLVARSLKLPTLIFDEIDTGISGEAAKQVGRIMQELATQLQVICITHQPQIAAKAHAHYWVYKETVDQKVQTNMRRLSTEEQVIAIAQMLDGAKPGAAALQHAKELMHANA